ncbi:MFS-type transporter SLC18B1-like isoform X2 [Rhopilema esculentum]|uniref:MFS-type transporter SLC18B1-like isoform X2 n=1 Tax=Rhopilema esculentum TaxID=499914 RepID=UPI0031DBCD73
MPQHVDTLFAPPQNLEADSKGVSMTTSSLVFTTFALVSVICSPLIGALITIDGPKTVALLGLLIEGSTQILFGFTYKIQRKDLFLAATFGIRALSAVGGCASTTSALAMVANTFQSNMSPAVGVLETFAGFGLMAGPPIGGLLYRAGGFELPFLVVGSITLLTFFPFYFILPAMKIEKDPKDGNMKLIQAMKIPVVFFMGIITICTGMVLSFLDPIFQRHLNNTFHLGTVKVGLVFLIWGAAYAISAPALGTLAEKTDTRYAICSGAIIYGLSFPLLGPPPFISAIPSALWLNCVALAIAGLGLALYMVPALSDMYKSATRYGMSADLSTQSALASIFNSALHTGMAIGASLSGLLVQHFSFAWATTIFGIFQTIVGLMVFAFTFCERRSASYLRTKIKDKREIEKRPI